MYTIPGKIPIERKALKCAQNVPMGTFWAHFGHKSVPMGTFFCWGHFGHILFPKCAQNVPVGTFGHVLEAFLLKCGQNVPKCAHLQKCSKNVPKCAQWQSIKSQFYIQWWHFGHILGTIFEPLQNVPTAFWFVLNFSTLMQRYHRRMGS